jgi:hypothetical protein
LRDPARVRGRLGRCALGAAAFAPLLAAALWLPGSGVTSHAEGQTSAGEPVPQTDASLPARDVTMIGSSPQEAPGETWGIGRYNGAAVVVRYTDETGWSSPALGLLDSGDQPLKGFQLAHPEGFRFANPSPLAGQMTADGGGALVGTIPAAVGGGGVQQVVLVREPGGSFQETAPVPAQGAGALLKQGEGLFGINRAPMVAALEEPGGKAGALVVPVNEGGGVDTGVLHWNGASWTREPIEIPAKSEEQFEALAIGASSPGNAWLIAKLSSEYPTGSVALFRRHLGKAGETPTWQPAAARVGGEPGEPLAVEAEGKRLLFTVPNGDQSQVLSVTEEGVWIDGVRRDAQASTTVFFKPEGEAAGHVLASWCKVPAGAPPGTPSCRYELPEPLPTNPSRSFAWANPSTPEGLGERVITGLSDGVSLRLEGTEFKRVPALGGSAGASFGAAFASPSEGWLGKELLPVHLTLHPLPSRLALWPVPFRHALVALAPQPGAPVGSPSSQVLAVGDQGEVSRYEPAEGWVPESLLGAGGRREAPRLRAVAWPTPTRTYAVGDLGQMWLWRGETGLWEPDPATPANFRGNLLGIAFDPNNSARGYAVGEGGVLLRYGKTWTQEPEQSALDPRGLPPQVKGASFTSIAFAGSQAIVAYRRLPNPAQEVYEGGLIVNDGSGWQIDQGAAAAIGSNVPWTVAGLPDGGAAFTASGIGESAQVYERQSAGAPWQAVPAHLPVGASPGSLALFREGGALRAIAAGSQPDTYQAEGQPSPPPGFPPTLVPPYPLPSDPERGVLRQTASGWSDEEHELNSAKEPPGDYAHYDTGYMPDPVLAVLVDSTGSEGWAVGGMVDDENKRTEGLDTADVWRYPADGFAPVGVGSSPVPSEPGASAFAIGGGAQCAAPCADRMAMHIGPDVWLAHALAVADQISGLRAFIYTGPRVTSGETAGPATLVVPYKQELERYAQILHSGSKPAYAAASPTDLDGGGSEATLESTFSGFPAPFGEPSCATPGCQSAYYALPETVAGAVRVIVLDNSTPVGEAQLTWLERELKAASTAGKPAIVVGNANIAGQIEAGGPTAAAAAKVARILVCGTLAAACKRLADGASAYFFDSPEQNVKLPLRVGGESIETYGSGTLGYVSNLAEASGGFIGASGFLLVQVGAREKGTNHAQVNVELIPNIGELAMEAQDGTLIRRSHVALFDALARRPLAGNRAHSGSIEGETNPYIPIPSNCVGSACAHGEFPQFTFSSSNEGQIGEFVTPNLAAGNRAVLLGSGGKPIHDSKSGLFCAYNAGTTTVTISAGGLSYSMPVTVQAGSVSEPCGTVPLKNLPLKTHSAAAVPPPAPAPTPSSAPASTPPVVPLPPLPAPVVAPPARVPARPAPPPPRPFFTTPIIPIAVPAFVPPPPPPAANPTPPSGTSAVTSPVQAAQREEEEEEATESVGNQAMAYRSSEHEPSSLFVLGIVVLAAFAGASIRRPGRGRREVRVAPATLSTIRMQRRLTPRRGRRS